MPTTQQPASIADIRPRPASRDVALDAMRGLALLLMVASGRMPFDSEKSLPAWMYHAQEPPPSHDYRADLPGLTWVDLVFPLFLFALGAAIPLAYTRRLQRDPSRLHILLHTLHRGALLVWFALYRNYTVPFKLSQSPGRIDWAVGLLAFALLFPMFARLPDQWPNWISLVTRLIGFGSGFALLYWLYHGTGRHFSLGDSDIILMVLANMVVFGALIWLCTPRNPQARLAIMALIVASRLSDSASHNPNNWIHALYSLSHLPFPPHWRFDWFFQLEFQKYLLIVLPGTIAGDLLLEWRKAKAEIQDTKQEGRKGGRQEEIQDTNRDKGDSERVKSGNLNWVVGVAGLIVIALLVGLQGRWVEATTGLVWLVCLGTVWGMGADAGGGNPDTRLLRALVRWGSGLLVLGLMLEPFQGGIKKDSATLSYLLLTPGIACFLLGALILLASRPVMRRPLGFLADVGQNPMIGYVGMDILLLPIVALTGLEPVLSNWFITPWQIALRAALETLLLAGIVSLCTRLRVYWRT